MKNKIVLLISLLVILFSLTAFADNIALIDNATLTNYKMLSGDNQYGFGSEKIGSTYYISYLKEINGYEKEYVASSIDLINWTIVNLNGDDSNQAQCFLFRDVNNDLICVYYYDDNSLFYWIKKNGEDWYNNKTEITESSLSTSSGTFANIKNYGSQLHLFTANSGDDKIIMDYILNLEKGSYTKVISDLGSLTHYTYVYDEDRKGIYKEGLNDYIYLASYPFSSYSFLYAKYSSGSWGSMLPHLSGVDRFHFLYMTDNYDYYIYIGTNNRLYYAKRNKNTDVWGSSIDLYLVKNVLNENSGTMIEGENNLWFAYIDTEDNNLRLAKIPKSSDLSIESDIVLDNSGNIDYLGSALGSKQLEESTLQLYDNYLIVPYMTNNKIYTTKYDTSDSIGIGTTDCSLTPEVLNVSVNNANPVCFGGVVRSVLFTYENANNCSAYQYFYCADCDNDLPEPTESEQGYYDFFPSFWTESLYKYSTPTYITIRGKTFNNTGYSTIALLNGTNSSPIDFYHCNKIIGLNTEDVNIGCSGAYDNVNFTFKVQINDYDSDFKANAMDFRTLDNNDNYVNIMMFNESNSSDIPYYDIYYYYGSSYHKLLGTIRRYPDCLLKVKVINNFVTDTYDMYVDSCDDLIYEYTFSGLPFVNPTDNIAKYQIYQDVGTKNNTNSPNIIDYIDFDIPEVIISNITDYNLGLPVQAIDYFNTGLYTPRFCVQNLNATGNKVDCYTYNLEVKNCSVSEWYQEPDYTSLIPETDIGFRAGDLAYDFNVWLYNMGIRSMASKMFIAIILIIVFSLLGFIVSQGNIYVATGIAFLTLMGSVFLQLIPIWVVILLVILCAGIIFMFFKGNG
jgi:hypothetical protein